MNATCFARWRPHLSRAARMLMIAAAVVMACQRTDAQGPSVIGQWEPTILCDGLQSNGWPDGSMHCNHVVMRVTISEGVTELQGRILLWYSPGCPGIGESVLCGTISPPIFPACTDLSGCQQLGPQLMPGCGALPSGLSTCFGSNPTSRPPRIWNPMTGLLEGYVSSPLGPPPPGTPPPASECEIVNDCNGHVGLWDGKLLVVGGGCGPVNADRDTLIFDPEKVGTAEDPWTKKADMVARRWYPTATTLPDGRVLITSGAESEDGPGQYVMVNVPEIYNPYTDTWAWQHPFEKSMNLYPFMFVRHDGKLFWAGSGANTGTLDLAAPVSGTAWTMLPPHTSGNLFCINGAAVTYAPGKVLKSGGFNPEGCSPVARTAKIDLTVASPIWKSEVPDMDMNFARKDHNLVMLPDGRVLAVGGQRNCTDTCTSDLVVCANCVPERHAEWCDPNLTTPVWIELAEAVVPRGYHNTALLLWDGRVMISGGEDSFGTAYQSARSAELFKPPYLFNPDNTPAVQPVISSGQELEKIGYGGTFTITMPSGQPATITKAALVRVGSPTHGFDQNQRYVPLNDDDPLTPLPMPGVLNPTTLRLSAPKNANEAPPGYYMLFVMRNNGAHKLPSKAKFVLVGACREDLDCDCDVDSYDLPVLLAEWTGSSLYPDCPPTFRKSDLNLDCFVNGTDLAMLLGAGTGQCPVGCVPTGCSGGSSAMGGGEGGEPASSAPAGGPITSDCGGSFEVFLQWLESGDMDSFWQWYDCMMGLAGGATQ